ncbi:GNAT family N-acetyltransferase [Halovulum dunhuangense]|uniref:GNAT family N-acetyltransferase n=1 Tax=Halovulum dunhuangense TaxID=1505036 RepID=A0A849L4L3_9RHOB|nr:GNAT family N-acetyltransferase [Halovulum dunhuangense]NNU81132.1 GNAT family N-acetyltransferase [Halovulum dunhuangense]
MIRHARMSDIQQLRYLAQTQFAPYATRIRGKREPLAKDLRDLVAEDRIIVFIVENAIGGFISYRIDGPNLHIEAVAVNGAQRRRGVGRILLDKADRDGLRAGCRRAIFHTNAQGFENLSYYRAKGFVEIDRRQENGFERVVMERGLQ